MTPALLFATSSHAIADQWRQRSVFFCNYAEMVVCVGINWGTQNKSLDLVVTEAWAVFSEQAHRAVTNVLAQCVNTVQEKLKLNWSAVVITAWLSAKSSVSPAREEGVVFTLGPKMGQQPWWSSGLFPLLRYWQSFCSFSVCHRSAGLLGFLLQSLYLSVYQVTLLIWYSSSMLCMFWSVKW